MIKPMYVKQMPKINTTEVRLLDAHLCVLLENKEHIYNLSRDAKQKFCNFFYNTINTFFLLRSYFNLRNKKFLTILIIL
jgi:hypothetical protein